MRILVTGGAGFLGSHLCDFLIEQGHTVVCMDNLITGSPDNIAHLYGKNFTFIKYDVTEYVYVPGELNYILHFASPASPIDYLQYPIQTLKVGALGTHKLLGLAKEKNAKFLLASTSEVYGDPLEHPQKESYLGNVNPIGLRGVYDEAKRFAESMVMAYHRFHHSHVKIARIFNTYGPRMRLNDGRVIPNFIYQALRNEPVTIYGDGSQTRSFCYVSDLILGIYALMMSDYQEPINIGNPGEFTILELAKQVKELLGSSSSFKYEPLPEGDPRMRRPDISKAKEILRWEPRVKLAEGLQLTIRWFQDQISGRHEAGFCIK